MALYKIGKNALFMPVTKHISYIISTISLLLLWPATTAVAFSNDTYTSRSVLADGNWVKVGVSESGVHFLSSSQLRSWGFNDITKVTVWGYGAQRLPDVLERSTFIDDLPRVQVERTSGGIYFYAVGPVDYETVSGDKLRMIINPFTTKGYYYLTDSQEASDNFTTATPMGGYDVATSYNEISYHKRELFNKGETGHTLLGEDFLSQATQNFDFSLPGRIDDTPVWLECRFHANSKNASRIVLSVNNSALPYTSSDNISGFNDHYVHSAMTTTAKTFDMTGDKARVSVTHSCTGAINLSRLEHIVINYQRALELTSSKADFRLKNLGGRLSGAGESTRLWDVTNPFNVIKIDAQSSGNGLSWQPCATGLRHYVAWQPDAKLPSPSFISKVSNQDLHGVEVPDMVIFTPGDWRSQAERVANLHRDSEDPLSVLIVEPDQVYNEFSSGAPDANALRKFLKMLWDRSVTSQSGSRLQYLLIMGRSIFDNRRIIPTMAALKYPTLPCWQTDNSLSDNSSYITDDIYAMLADGAGGTMRNAYHCIGVGRMPVTSLSDARNVVDKLYQYVHNPINSEWKNRALMVADDGNNGVFMEQTERMIDIAAATRGGDNIIWNKIYIDAYQKQNSTYPGARSDMFRALTEGVMWWNFTGHANPTSWTGDGLMTYTDINNLYLKHFPFVVAATCDFMRWDGATISAAEIMYRTESTGIIGAISATRPAYIDSNGEFLARMGATMFVTDDDGRTLPIGEIFRRTKNGSAAASVWSNDNKLRYALMGDPAMRLCVPSSRVKITGINGNLPAGDDDIVLQASQDIVLEGIVTDARGEQLGDFDGRLYVTLYDAEFSRTSHGYGEDGKEVTFEDQGTRLQSVVGKVEQGRFKVDMVMPDEIANNYRPATLNLYAVDNDGSRDAVSVNRDLYVFGYCEDAITDNEPPVIEAFYLNSTAFNSGDLVNETPVVIARVSDNRSINLSSAGIGHQMLLSIDNRSLTDTPLFYTPSDDGTPGGTLMYQLDKLAKGNHELRFRVWDTAGNSATASLEFNVDDNVSPNLYEVYADANPASVDTRFYVTHDRPSSLINVNIEVYNLMGRRIWSSTVNGMSDVLKSFPVTWNLTDYAGRRVARGIYLYRASITDSTGNTSSTHTNRIAVTGN